MFFFQVPKMGAVKRGWVRQFVVVCDFKLFLYDITADRSALPSVHVSQVCVFGVNILRLLLKNKLMKPLMQSFIVLMAIMLAHCLLLLSLYLTLIFGRVIRNLNCAIVCMHNQNPNIVAIIA